MVSVALPPQALAALLEKYNQLVRLRAQRDSDPHGSATSVGKLALRSLAQVYPGCLRELDRLPLTALRQRQAAVAEALAGGPVAPWMMWIWGYHQLLGAALAHKAGRPTVTIPWPPLEPDFLAQALNPPGGRLSHVVMAELARQVGQPPDALAAALFPPRRLAGAALT